MYRGKRIVVVTPAGRRDYLKMLIPYVMRERNIIDQYRFWVNTVNPCDIEYIQFQVDSDPKPDWQGNRRVRLIHKFFANCTETDTIYIRLDDDICWMMPNAIQKLLDYRIENPDFFLVYPAIFNNGYTAQIHASLGLIELPNTTFRRWQRELKWGILHHEKLLEAIGNHTTEHWMFDSTVINDYAQAPINCISWLGEEFAKFAGLVANESCDFLEEVWLTKIKPRELGKHNCMYGGSLMSHFAFNTQRKHFENKTSLFQNYEILSLYDGQVNF